MDLLWDLSSRMSATEEILATHKETESKYPPARSVRDDMGIVQPDWQPNNLAVCMEGQPPEMAQETHRQVARRLKRGPNMHNFYSDDDSDSEEEQGAQKKRRTAIKSGKVRTADTTVRKQILWPQELVYDPSGKPAAYDELPLPLFIQGYLAILQTEKPQKRDIMLKHLSDLMADAAIYGWESVRAFHAVWLQQLENGRVDWGDEDKKLEFWRALVWNKAREGHTTTA